MVTTRTGVKQQEPKKQSVLKQLNVKVIYEKFEKNKSILPSYKQVIIF